MPEKTFTDLGLFNMITIFLVIVFGGVVGSAQMAKQSGVRISSTGWLLNGATHVFFGVLAAFACAEYQLSFWATGVVVGLVSFLGNNAVYAFKMVRELRKNGIEFEIKVKEKGK